MGKKLVNNQEILKQFKKAAAVLEVIDDNPFRIRAYRNAIDTIINLDEELAVIRTRKPLEEIYGIGKELAEKINELIDTGESRALNKLFAKVPAGMFSLLDIPGIGAKRAYFLAEHFGLNQEEGAVLVVKKAAEESAISKLPGFGAKSEANLLENLKRHKPKSDRMRLDEADKLAGTVLEFLRTIPEITRVEALGSLRRRRETVGDIDIGASTTSVEKVQERLKDWELTHSLQAVGQNLIRLVLLGNKQVDIKFSAPEEFGSVLQHFTGSKQHNVALREYALTKGMSLSEYGIKEKNKLLKFKDEVGFYAHLGLSYIEPEMRENWGEIEAAGKNKLPDLVTLNQIKGDFHTHTDYPWASSHDYGDSVANLLDQAVELNYEWLALGDHNPSTTAYESEKLADEVKKRTQWLEQKYSSWKKRVKIDNHLRIFITLEVDILRNGELPLPVEALDYLGFVMVSVHSAFDLPVERQTERILKALSRPKVKIMAHPTGRMVNRRPSISANWDKIFDYCREKGIAVEINANPRRLDLPDTLVRLAVKKGVLLSLGSDAHRAGQMSYMSYALGNARRGWATPDDIINRLSYNELVNWFLAGKK